MNRTRLAVLTVAPALAALALTGCSAGSGGSEDASPAPATSVPAPPAASASPAAFVAQAADTTEAVGSARVSSTTSLQGRGGQSTTITADGLVDFAGDAASLQVTSPLFGGESGIQLILTGGKSYVQVPQFGDKWISMPLDEFGIDVTNPAQGLDALRTMTDLTEAGTEDLDGVATTKYTGTVDLAQAIGTVDLPADVRKEADKVSGTADVTVWVDGEGRVVRFDQKASIDAQGQQVQTDSSTTLSDFGVKADITPPPADQVMDGSALKQLGDMAGQAG